jgi:hypothetical protein
MLLLKFYDCQEHEMNKIIVKFFLVKKELQEKGQYIEIVGI